MMSFISEIASGLVSPITGAISAIFVKKDDVKLEMYKVDGKYDVEAMRQDTEIIRARSDLAKAMKDDPVNKWGRRLFIYPTGVWYAGIIAYCFIHPYIPSMPAVLAVPPNLEYVPYAVVAYLLVTAWKK